MLSKEWFGLPDCHLSKNIARSHCGYFRKTATHLVKGAGCLLIKIPLTLSPHHPAQIKPLSVGLKENRHGWIWFIHTEPWWGHSWPPVLPLSHIHPGPLGLSITTSPRCPALTPPVARTQAVTLMKRQAQSLARIKRNWLVINGASLHLHHDCVHGVCTHRVALSIMQVCPGPPSSVLAMCSLRGAATYVY